MEHNTAKAQEDNMDRVNKTDERNKLLQDVFPPPQVSPPKIRKE